MKYNIINYKCFQKSKWGDKNEQKFENYNDINMFISNTFFG